MRWVMGAVVAVLVATGGYMGSAVAALNGLVQAARAGDGAEVLARTDLPRLRHSLVDQIVAAYLKRIGQDRPVKPLERMVANTYGVSIADAMVGKLLTEQNLTNMLRNGTFDAGGAETANMQRLSELDTSKIFETISRLSIIKPVEFLIRLGDNENSAGVSIHFEGNGWKLSGIQLPATAVQALAQVLSENKDRKKP
jgi:Protein of unknown function (DUF2939)